MPDATAHDAIIRPDTRTTRGDHGALDDAFEQIRVEYLKSLDVWARAGIEPVFHVKLTIDRPPENGHA